MSQKKIPLPFDLHSKYSGKSSNNKSQYLLSIQQLYNLKNELQMINKKLYDIFNKKTEYKNKNKKFIQSEIDKFTKAVIFNKNESDKILEQVKLNTFKTNAIKEYNLFLARKIIIERIDTLDAFIRTLPALENTNNELNFNNEGPDYNNDSYMKKTPIKSLKMRPNPLLGYDKIMRNAEQKKQTKAMRQVGLKNDTYPNSKKQTNQYRREQLWNEQQREWENSPYPGTPDWVNRNNNYGYPETPSSENNYNRYGRPELVPTTSGYSMHLSASEARNYHNGLWNRIHVPSKWSNPRQTRSKSQIKPHVSNSGSENNSRSSRQTHTSNSESENNSRSQRQTHISNSESESNSRRSHSRNSRLENSNSGYVSNNQFLGNRFKRRAESKQKRGSLEFTSE